MTEPAPTATLVHLDPNTLHDHPSNVRDEVGDLDELTASIRQVGILEPLTVVPTDDGHRIVTGHRRKAAAIAAGLATVPCYERPDLGADSDQVLAMLIENLRRHDLTELEEARGYQQLLDLGLSATKIAKATGTPRTRVRDALAVTKSDTALTTATAHGLTLDQALVLTEFAGDDEALDTLTDAAVEDPDQLLHVASRIRQDRERQAEYERLVAEHETAGVTILEQPPESHSSKALGVPRILDTLIDGDDQVLDPDQHASCPGHAVWIEKATSWHSPTPEPTRALTRRPTGTATATAPAGRTSSPRRPRPSAARSSRTTRHGGPPNPSAGTTSAPRSTAGKVPKGTLRFVTAEIMADPAEIGRGPDDLIAELAGVTTEATDTSLYQWGRTAGPALEAKASDARAAPGAARPGRSRPGTEHGRPHLAPDHRHCRGPVAHLPRRHRLPALRHRTDRHRQRGRQPGPRRGSRRRAGKGRPRGRSGVKLRTAPQRQWPAGTTGGPLRVHSAPRQAAPPARVRAEVRATPPSTAARPAHPASRRGRCAERRRPGAPAVPRRSMPRSRRLATNATQRGSRVQVLQTVVDGIEPRRVQGEVPVGRMQEPATERPVALAHRYRPAELAGDRYRARLLRQPRAAAKGRPPGRPPPGVINRGPSTGSRCGTAARSRSRGDDRGRGPASPLGHRASVRGAPAAPARSGRNGRAAGGGTGGGRNGRAAGGGTGGGRNGRAAGEEPGAAGTGGPRGRNRGRPERAGRGGRNRGRPERAGRVDTLCTACRGGTVVRTSTASPSVLPSGPTAGCRARCSYPLTSGRIMLTIAKLGVGQESYYLSKVAQGIEDYYTGQGESAGAWLGRGAARLGLGGEVAGDELRAVLGGVDPVTGRRLAGREGAKRTPGWDLTFSAPKSVSVLFGLDIPRVVGVKRRVGCGVPRRCVRRRGCGGGGSRGGCRRGGWRGRVGPGGGCRRWRGVGRRRLGRRGWR